MSQGSTTAALLTRPGKVEVTEMALADPGVGEVLIRVRTVGLCGSDAHWFEEGSIGDAELGTGLVLGHELCGVIESGPRAGERVAVDPGVPCLVCEQCGSGRQNLCVDLRFAGHGETHGGLRHHMIWPERCLVSIRDDITDEVGALLEPLGVSMHAVDLADVDDSMTVGVVGCGPIGLLTIVALQASGLTRIAATDPLAHRLQAAESLGAMPEPAMATDRLDVVFDAAGTNPAVAATLATARPGGRVVIVGIPPEDRTSLESSLARRKELTVRWCRRMMPGDLARAMSVAVPRADELAGLVTHRYPLNEVGDAFDRLVRRSGIKVTVSMETPP